MFFAILNKGESDNFEWYKWACMTKRTEIHRRLCMIKVVLPYSVEITLPIHSNAPNLFQGTFQPLSSIEEDSQKSTGINVEVKTTTKKFSDMQNTDLFSIIFFLNFGKSCAKYTNILGGLREKIR